MQSRCPSCAAELPDGFAFCGHCGTRLEAPPARRQVDPAQVVGVSAERREVTVVFADVMGFTPMCERLDPEDVHALMNECFTGLGGAVQEEDGHIDKYIGDALMALFGAPLAHEDDPARACRAALAMQAFLRDFARDCEQRTGIPLRMRIGIHCGLVLAGEVGSAVRMDYSVMGDSVNLAQRLESAAAPGSVLVSADVVRRTQGLFAFGPRQHVTVKGKEQPVAAHELLSIIAAVSPRGRDGMSVDLIGRVEELEQLLALWRRAEVDPRERWIEIRGELGIGKTRLAEAAAARSGRSVLVVSITPDVARRSFGLIRQLLHAVLDRLGSATQPATPAVPDALARRFPGLVPYTDLLSQLVSPHAALPFSGDDDPPARRRTLERATAATLDALAATEPELTMLLDSIECADPASLDLLEALARSRRRLPLPLLVTTRDSERPPLFPSATVRLGRLPETEAEMLLKHLVRGAPLPPQLRQNVLERAAGVPLHLEEMVRSLVDDGIVRASEDGGASWSCDATAAAPNLPPTLRAAMTARLDRLPRAARELLCQCAIQGNTFDLRVAEAVFQPTTAPAASAADLLAELERRGVVAKADARATRFGFRQPLMQEACYEILRLRDRRLLHAQVAAALCTFAGDSDAVPAELLAHHYERAEAWAAAARANLRAGNQAGELYLNEDALRRYRNVTDQIDRLSAASRGDRSIAVAAYAGMARVHLLLGAYAHAEEAAREMAGQAGGPVERAEADRLLAAVRLHTGAMAEAEGFLQGAATVLASLAGVHANAARVLADLTELLSRSDRLDEASQCLQRSRALAPVDDHRLAIRLDTLDGKLAHTRGRFREAATAFARAYETAEHIGSLAERARAANSMGNVARDEGDYDAAAAHFGRALDLWERTGDTECIAGARTNLGNLAMSRGDFEIAATHHERSLSACEEIGNVHGAALARINLAILAVERGDGGAAADLADAAAATLPEAGHALLGALAKVVAAEGLLVNGNLDAAAVRFDEVLRQFDGGHHPLAVAGARRGLGRVALARGRGHEALTLLTKALEEFEGLCRSQEAARTAVYRAMALRSVGDLIGARTVLADAHERFITMHALHDANRSAALLRELS